MEEIQPTPSTGDAPPPKDDAIDEPLKSAKPTKFRFKSEHSRSSRHRSRRDRDEDILEDENASHRSSRHRHRQHSPHHHRHRRRRRSRSPPIEPPPLPLPKPQPDNPPSSGLDPDAAFRESLFDAMADDEGAAYWEAIYGQPIHVYSSDRERVSPATGELERMSDEQYAAHVRQKMWEKTHAGLLEERARRAEQREERRKREEEGERIAAEVERSLRKGEARRKKRAWRDRWDGYLEGWAGWDGSLEKVPWPTENRRRREIEERDVRAFFVKGLDLEELGEKEFAAKLKEERVRWHPDKIQQKLKGEFDDAVMKDVTAIFQIIDKLWADTRPKS